MTSEQQKSKPQGKRNHRPRINYADRRRKAKPAVTSRQIVQDLMQMIIGKGLPLQDALSQHEGWSKLEDRDRRFTRRLITIILRHHGEAKAVLKSQMTKPLSRRDRKAEAILIMAVVELIWADSDSHAAVDQAVKLMRSAGFRHLTGLANGVLRNIDRRQEEIKSKPLDPMVNAPSWLEKALNADYGQKASSVMANLLMPPALDLRPKSDAADWAERLGGALTPHGSIRLSDGMVSGLDGYQDGAWWVQDSAASIPALLISSILGSDLKGKTIIDCCAAPGGKTAQLCASGAEVIALDQSKPRMKTLTENMKRLKMSPQIVVADGMTWRPEGSDEALVDAVLLDAPCSATGTIRRRPDILSHQSPPDLANLNHLQRGLFEQAISWLKPGGILVYATCSVLKAEGEMIVENLPEGISPSPIDDDEIPGFNRFEPETQSWGHMMRIMPDSLDFNLLKLDSGNNLPQGNDSFFIARFIKN